MNSKALIVPGVAAVVAIAVYSVLNWRAPYVEPVERLKPNLEEQKQLAEEVFSSDINNTAPVAPADAPAAAEPAPPPPEPVAAAAETPEPAAEAVETQAAEPVEAAAAPVAEEPAVAEPPTPEPAVAEAEPAPVVKAAETVAAPKAAAKPSKAVKKKAPPPADALRTWWPQQPAPGSLNLLYAGQVEGSDVIALMFDGGFADVSSVPSHIQVVDTSGKAVDGPWVVGRSARLLTLAVPRKGRYTVMLKAGLTDQQGKTLSAPLYGPVYVQ